MANRDLLSPFARITMGNGDRFTFGDGYLKSVSVSLDEGENCSGGKFSIYDPGCKFTDKYLLYIEAVRGLTNFENPKTASTATKGTIDTLQSVMSADGSLDPKIRAFLDLIAWKESQGYNSLVGNKTFSSFQDHPGVLNPQLYSQTGQNSDAAGRYQFISTTFTPLKNSLNLPDFSPISQDKAAALLLVQLGASSKIMSGDIAGAILSSRSTWSSLPGASQSDPSYTTDQAIAYYNTALSKYNPGTQQSQSATESTQSASNLPSTPISKVSAQTGSQIIIELGFNGRSVVAYSYIHTGLEFDRFAPFTLNFTGTAAIWVLAQRKKNTAYKDLTFKQIASKIAKSYGLTLDMKEDGAKYQYFPQRGRSDYEALLIEAKRLGYRIYSKGNKLIINPRSADKAAFFIELGDNLGSKFVVSHKAYLESQINSSNNKTFLAGQRKTIVDIDTGIQKIINLENPIGKGIGSDKSITGKAIVENKPKTDGLSDDSDRIRRLGEAISEITFSAKLPTTPEVLLIDPDTPIATKGISTVIDRFWIPKAITHTLDKNGFETEIEGYSPLRYSQKGSGKGTIDNLIALNPNGFIKPATGDLSDTFGSRNGEHKGIDIAAIAGSNVTASADGVVADSGNACIEGDVSCNGRYGNFVYITHANGISTRYAHMQTGSVTVNAGNVVKQGQIIGKVGNTGGSTGAHLHFEVREGATAVNPLKYIKI